MNSEDTFKLLVSGYYGISEMDQYSLKIYILKDLENYIRDFVSNSYLYNFPFQHVCDEIQNRALKEKLQDALLVLQMIDGPIELKLMIRERIKDIEREGYY